MFSQMSAVRARIQWQCKTKRRQWATARWLLHLLLLQGLAAAPTTWNDSTLDECHDEYLLASAKATSIYAANFEQCELTANETKIDLSINETLERTQIEAGHSTLCGNLDYCDALDDDLDYFACVRDRGSHNLELITEINHNATSAHTRLREDYDAVQQTLVLCTLEAQVVYVNSMREAHEELHQCRSELGREGNEEEEAETGSPN